jgi:hypothetical protein
MNLEAIHKIRRCRRPPTMASLPVVVVALGSYIDWILFPISSLKTGSEMVAATTSQFVRLIKQQNQDRGPLSIGDLRLTAMFRFSEKSRPKSCKPKLVLNLLSTNILRYTRVEVLQRFCHLRIRES